MPVDPNAPITITAYDWVPDFARGQVRDLRVRWALEEVGRDYAVRRLVQGAQKAAAHRALQPFGQVPTYEEGDLALFESGAIVWHVAERYPGLMPQEPGARARSLQWMIAALNSVEPVLSDWVNATLFEAGEPWSAARVPSIEKRIGKRLGAVADRLGEAEWLAGAFGPGDLMMVSVLGIVEDGPLLAAFPTLAAYVARGKARPAFGRALGAQLAGFTGDPPPGFDEWMAELERKRGETA